VNTDWRIRNTGGNLVFNRADNTGTAANNGDFSVMTFDGKMGIGTTAPTQRLDVSGTLQMTNGSARFYATPAASSYGNVLMNGYFNIYRPGTSNTPPASNAVVQLAPEGGAAHYFMSNNVGIGTQTPAFILDVSSATTSQGVRVTAPNASFVAQAPGNANNLQMYSSTTGQGLFTGSNTIQISTNSVTGNNGIIVNGNQVGIGTAVPAYRLDVSAGTTAASVNMTSWPRVPVGNTYVAKGIVAYRTNAIQFSNALQDINAQLAVVTNDATNGTYFQIRRSGIWSIRIGPIFHSAAVSTSVLDVSTNISNLSLPGLQTPRTIDLFYSTLSNSTLTYTGYLPASTSLNYKPYNNNTTLTNNSNSAVFMLSFIAETPTGSANYPYTSYPT
jgi:hypothetical protein